VAVDAVVLVPDILAARHLRRDLVGIRELAELPVAVDRETEEGHRGNERGADGEQARLLLVHGESRSI